ncbi:MAG: phosphoglycerate kinase [Candidatus Neomarinimicrobiota bacterium]|nr:MAG: phosphoglycerate kinase [Candidatus Neomarinimicrobiota bacterium]
MVRSIKSFALKNKRVLLRLDLNVPLRDGAVADDFRIHAALPTMQYCLESGASLVIMSHLGRPKGQVKPDLSLIPVGEKIAEILEMPIKFSDDCISEDALDVSLGLKPGEIHLLENLRFHEEETSNDPVFSERLAHHGQIYINDAFGTAHRAHASNVGVAKQFSYKGIGFLIEKELRYLESVVQRPERPLTMILGGAKIDTKLALIDRFAEQADYLLIGGGMAFTFLQALGHSVGKSLVDPSMLRTATKILQRVQSQRAKLLFPLDVVTAPSLEDGDRAEEHPVEAIPETAMGLDIGSRTVSLFQDIIHNSKTIIWNGPLGVFEQPGFDQGTRAIAQTLAELKEGEQITVIGGGDTAAAVKHFGLMTEMSHVSTGGGASLELLSGNRLPAIIALETA